MATLVLRNKASSYKEAGKPCREGPPKLITGEVESLDGLRVCKQRYDIIQVDPDHIRSYGLSGSRGRDDPTNGMGNFIHLIIKVPGLSLNLKSFIERAHEDWGDLPKDVGEFKAKEPVSRLPRRYYVDINALPDFAKESLRFSGECTLTPDQAHRAIKMRADNSNDSKLFTHIEAIG